MSKHVYKLKVTLSYFKKNFSIKILPAKKGNILRRNKILMNHREVNPIFDFFKSHIACLRIYLSKKNCSKLNPFHSERKKISLLTTDFNDYKRQDIATSKSFEKVKRDREKVLCRFPKNTTYTYLHVLSN